MSVTNSTDIKWIEVRREAVAEDILKIEEDIVRITREYDESVRFLRSKVDRLKKVRDSLDENYKDLTSKQG